MISAICNAAPVILFLTLAVYTDIKKHLIPNKLIMAGILMDLAAAALRVSMRMRAGGSGRDQVRALFAAISISCLNTLAAMAVPVVLLYILFRLRMMGAGDIKLLSVIGGWTGPSGILTVIAASFLAGGVISIILMAHRRIFLKRLRYLKSYCLTLLSTGQAGPYRRPEDRSGEMAFSLPILIGFLMYLGGVFN